MKSKQSGKRDTRLGFSKTLIGTVAVATMLMLLFSLSVWQSSVSTVDLVLLSGTVLTDEGLVSGAVVRVKGQSTSTVTGPQGEFSLYATPTAERVTAWKEGYFIGGAAVNSKSIQVHLQSLPSEDNPDYAWVDPTPNENAVQNCGNCHKQIYQEWSASAHASAVSNRHFRNLYDGTDWSGKQGVGWNLIAEYPDGAGVCTACHAPSVAVDAAAFDDLRKTEAVSAMGVHCDFCHKVQAPEPVELGVAHGRFGLKLLRPSDGEQLFFGPLDDVDRDEDSYSAFSRESLYCASCHEGIMFGVHAYSTYSEWLDSPASKAGQTCQSCHMRPSGNLHNIAPGHGGIDRDPLSLASHNFPGGNIEMLKRCLVIRAQIVSSNDRVKLTVEVRTGNVGHRVPTGFVDRHLLLLISANDEAGRSVALTAGPVIPKIVGTELAGHPGRLFAKQLSDFEGKSPVPFWRAKPEYVDTRLYPNRAVRSTFVFGSSVRRLRIRFVYRRFWQEVAETKSWPDNETVIFDQKIPINHNTRKQTITLTARP